MQRLPPPSRTDRVRRNADDPIVRLIALIEAERERLEGLRASITVEQLVDHLADWLYSAWYTVPHPQAAPSPASGGQRTVVPQLRAALPAATRWHAGWVVVGTGAGGACLAGRRGEPTRELAPGEYANLSRPAMPVAPGDQVAVCERIDYVDRRSGFWGTHGAAGQPEAPLVRLYFSPTAATVPAVLRAVATALDAASIQYSLKAPAQAAEYARVDSLLVYIGRSDWRRFRAPARTLVSQVEPLLRPSVPPFTRALGAGVAFAEDTGPLASFGQSRCRAIAPAVAEIVRTAMGAPARCRALLDEALRAAKINPRQPWRSPLR